MKIMIFIGLKLAEILSVCGIGYFTVNVIGIKPEDCDNNWVNYPLMGVFSLAALLFIFVIYVGIYHAIKANWAWAERLRKK